MENNTNTFTLDSSYNEERKSNLFWFKIVLIGTFLGIILGLGLFYFFNASLFS